MNGAVSNIITSPKPCRVCGEVFLTTEKRLTQLHHICRECHLVYRRELRGRLKSEGRRFAHKVNPEARREYISSYRKRPDERHKVNARTKVCRALRRGNLIKKPCEVCGSDQVHGHHEDYSQPLNVRWLCDEHHRQRHKEIKMQEERS